MWSRQIQRYKDEAEGKRWSSVLRFAPCCKNSGWRVEGTGALQRGSQPGTDAKLKLGKSRTGTSDISLRGSFRQLPAIDGDGLNSVTTSLWYYGFSSAESLSATGLFGSKFKSAVHYSNDYWERMLYLEKIAPMMLELF